MEQEWGQGEQDASGGGAGGAGGGGAGGAGGGGAGVAAGRATRGRPPARSPPEIQAVKSRARAAEALLAQCARPTGLRSAAK